MLLDAIQSVFVESVFYSWLAEKGRKHSAARQAAVPPARTARRTGCPVTVRN